MSKTPTTYSESVDLLVTARQLQDRYYLHLGYIDMDAIYFAKKIGDKPARASICEVSGISSAWVRQLLSRNASQQRYCISAWDTEWSALPYPMQEWQLFEALYTIGVENDGKMRPKDVVDHGVIVDFLGVYWRDSHDVPSLLMSPEPLPIPPPPVVHAEEE